MSQGPVEAGAMSTGTPPHMGGQVQSVDAEGAMNGFTAVNGRASPPSSLPQTQPQKHAAADIARQAISPSAQEIARQPSIGSDRPYHHHPNGPNQQHMGASATNGLHKRKRSVVDLDGEQSSGDSSRSSRSPPTASPDVQMQEASSYPPPGAEQPEAAWNGQPNDEQAEHLRMLAPIQHENQQHLNGNYNPGPPMSNGHGMRPGYHKDENTGLITTNAGVQMDPKKRKRAFTNRTKTGCQTCRRRKKKCDEVKPECNNCTRGGFKCEGYTPRVSWPPENKAKGGKPMPPNQPLPPTPRELQEFSGNLHPRPPQQRPEDLSGTGHANMRPRPIILDDEPERPLSNGWHQSPYGSGYRPYAETKESVHGLPMHGMRDSYDRPMSSINGNNSYPQGPHSMPPQASPGAIGMAQQALYAVSRPPPSAYIMTDKEPPTPGPELLRMFNGEPYAHLSRDLQIFREATAALLKTFNDNSPSGPDERGRQFEPVLKPDPSRRRFSAISSQIQNRMGRDAFVEVPFKCEYGSNIRLGDNVYIEGGCHIADPREVFIDNGTQIGAGVKIIGKVIPLDPHIRCGGLLSPQAEGKARGVEIYIGKNVYIGSNTVIQPDESVDKRLEIGDYAYIKPGSVVSKDVPPSVVYGPRPANCDIISGIPFQTPSNIDRKSRMGR